MRRIPFLLPGLAVLALFAPSRPKTPRHRSPAPPAFVPIAESEPVPADDEIDSSCSIELRVVSGGEPVPGASVRAEHRDGGSRETETDATGTARLPDAEQLHGLRVRKVGFLLKRRVPAESQVVELVRASPLGGQVLFAGSDAPVPGASVRIWETDGDCEIDDAQVTDADGRFAIAGLRAFHPHELVVTLPGYGTRRVDLSPRAPPRELVVVLGSGGSIVGTTVAGAEVSVQPVGVTSPFEWTTWSGRDVREHLEGTRVRSGEDGRFAAEGLAVPGAYRVYARAADGRVGASDPIALSDEGAVEKVDVPVGRGSFRLRLLDPEGRTVQDAVVLLGSEYLKFDRETRLWHDVPSPSLVPDGLVSGLWELEVFAEGLLAPRSHVRIRPDTTTDLTLRLSRGGERTGRVVDDAGRPVPGARVAWVLHPEDRPRTLARETRTGQDGRFVLRGLPTGETGRTWVRAHGYGSVVQTSSMDFVLPRAPLVTGRIAAAGDWSWRFDDGEDTFAEEELVVDAAGRFAIFPPVADRPLRLTITDRPRVIVVEGIRGDTDLGDLEPAPLHDLSGRVLDPDGAPLAGARVELHSPWAWRVARTGTDGGFRLPESPRLAAWLRIQAPGYPDAWRLTEGGDLRLDRGGQVIGRLLDRDGRSAHFILISFRRCTAQGEPAGSEYWDTSPDSIGRFRVLLPPGRFRARSIGPGYTGGRAPGPIVEITEGARTEIEFRLPWSLPAWR